MAIRAGVIALAGLAAAAVTTSALKGPLFTVAAQSLADAARAAEAQQKENAGRSTVIAQPFSPDTDETVTLDAVRRYGVARRRIAEAVAHDGALRKYVKSFVDQPIRNYDGEVESIIAGDVQLTGIVRQSGFSPFRYVQVERVVICFGAANGTGVKYADRQAYGDYVNAILDAALRDEQITLKVPSWTQWLRKC